MLTIGSCLSLLLGQAWAEPSLIGQSGLIAMPDSHIDAAQSWRLGLSHASPYTTLWSSVTALPWLEVSGRVTQISGLPGFPDSAFEASYGDYKDKTFDVKLRLAAESATLPSLSLGLQDYLGTGIFRANYLAASKRVGAADFTLGVGDGRIDGVFGGVRYSPAWLPDAALVLEYDGNDYARDLGSGQTGVAQRGKGLNLAMEYRWGSYGAQLAYLRGEVGINAQVRIPLAEKSFVPKHAEPPPDVPAWPQPSETQWREDPVHRQRAVRALLGQDFRNIRLHHEGRQLSASLTNLRISRMSRAIGRAARILVALAPRECTSISITYLRHDQAMATYSFVDLPRLRRYFSGLATRRELVGTVRVEHARPQRLSGVEEEAELLDSLADERAPLRLADEQSGDFVALQWGDPLHHQLRITPQLSLFVNDPSGAFRYDLHALAGYSQRIKPGQYLSGALRLTLAEDISQVTTQSNSLLPHVRTDVAEYKRAAQVKLDHLLWSHYWQPRRRTYARASVGLYEEMFGGVGGQVLYLPQRGDWAGDLSLDWVRQRDYQGTGFLGYSTVTALASLHYRLPSYGLTATLRAGRFLARDEGVRLEAKRRFRSGIEMGAWYTVTNGNDITTPGSPDNPYNDKGLFLSIPMDLVLPQDTQSVAYYALSPWTRDVGQMVASPGDLYSLVEKPLMLDMRDFDGLTAFGDVNDDYRLPELGDGVSEWAHLRRFTTDGIERVGELFSLRTVAFGTGLTVLSAALDDPVERFARDHGGDAPWRQLRKAGEGLSLLSWAGSAALAAVGDDPRLTRTAYSAFQAGAATLAVGGAIHFAAGRDSPQDGHGQASFSPFALGNIAASAFPSLHSGLAWATLTPYAKEYDMPWLYGAAGLASLATATGREHWLSDALGGALLGYFLGDLTWRGNRQAEDGPRLWLGAQGVALEWQAD